MRIHCPFCGERDVREFTYLGDAKARHSLQDASRAPPDIFEAVYLRDNPAGPHEELWYHGFGCRSWVRVTRNTHTHEVLESAPASLQPTVKAEVS